MARAQLTPARLRVDRRAEASDSVAIPPLRDASGRIRTDASSVVLRTSHLRLLEDEDGFGETTLVESYRRLADVFHEVLAEQSLDALLGRIAETVGELIPHDTLTIYEADEANGMLKPALGVHVEYVDAIMNTSISFTDGEGITGWAVSHREAVLANQAHLDPRVARYPGTPVEPESFICVPLIARATSREPSTSTAKAKASSSTTPSSSSRSASATPPHSRSTMPRSVPGSSIRRAPTR